MVGHRFFMVAIAAQRKQPAMHIWMQGFHPPIHHFWKSCNFRDIAHIQPRIAQHFSGSPGGDQCNLARGQCGRELNNTGFV